MIRLLLIQVAVTAGYAHAIIPSGSAANGKLLFLTSGAGGTDGTYTAGKFVIKIWGAPVAYIV